MGRRVVSSSESAPYPRDRVTAGILAGGRATRMGGQDKGLVELAGRPMIEYVLEALREQTSEVLINANRNLQRYQSYGLKVVRDREGDFRGPLAGMASLMAAARSEWLLVAPCDSPLVPADLGPRLWQAVVRDDAAIGVADSGNRLEPVFALLRCDLLADLETWLASGERKIDRWYRRHRMGVADCSDCPQMFVNVNTPAECDTLAEALKASNQRRSL